jgi:hypothetical protein
MRQAIIMDEERKKLEACGDGLLLAVARLYLRDQQGVPYKIHMRLISRMVNNRTLSEKKHSRYVVTARPPRASLDDITTIPHDEPSCRHRRFPCLQ